MFAQCLSFAFCYAFVNGPSGRSFPANKPVNTETADGGGNILLGSGHSFANHQDGRPSIGDYPAEIFFGFFQAF
jgi:hypothetical protein